MLDLSDVKVKCVIRLDRFLGNTSCIYTSIPLGPRSKQCRSVLGADYTSCDMVNMDVSLVQIALSQSQADTQH